MLNIKAKKGFRAAIGLIAMLLVMNLGSISAYAANYNSLQVFGTDTIAGYSALLTSSETYANQELTFSVTKPDGSVIKIPTVTNQDGVAKVDLYDYHTRKAGRYEVYGQYNDGSTGPSSSFTVYPDEVSVEQSSIVANKGVATANGQDEAYITVNLRDRYSNAFEGHVINLISSRPNDDIQSKSRSSLTDINGSATFTASSSEKGVSVYSAVDSTTGVVLSSRAQVAFMNPSEYLNNVGGEFSAFIPAANAAEAGPIHHFEISDIPSDVNPGQNVSFTVTAQDVDDNTVTNYTGEIHFSAEGENSENANLPEDYDFQAEDLGTHTFSLGLSFTTTGTYTIVATDIDEFSIKGETTVIVSTDGDGPPPGDGLAPTIQTPTEGTYSQNVQTISGSTDSGLTIKIFDNDQEIGNVQADVSGNYSYQTAPLADGVHSIYVVAVDGTDSVVGTSDTIEVTIDTTPPTADEITFEPSDGVNINSVIDVKVLSEESLSQAAIIFNADIIELSESLDQPGAYVGSMQAPADPGVYPVDIVLVDELGNEATYQEESSVTVLDEGETPAEEETPEEEVTPEEEAPSEEVVGDGIPPTQVFGVIAYGSDSRVTLVWEAASDDVIVDHYKIYYSTDPADLVNYVETNDAGTTWYIPNLPNGIEYYFAIVAVDDTGTESITRSEVVSGIPFSLELEAAVPDRADAALGLAEQDAFLRGVAIDGAVPPEMVKNGPELIWLLVGTGLMSGVARRLSRKRKKL